MFRRLKSVFVLVIALFTCESLYSQIDDIGLWAGVSINKKLTRQIEASLNEQLRLNHDLTTIDVLLSDAGISYEVVKNFKVALHYRFINSNQENYYSKRHRIYVDLSYKHKVQFVTFTLRERIQEQYTDIYSSDNGKIPTWNIRSKLAAKFDVNKKYSPYVSAEVYYLLDNAKEEDQRISRFRYEVGFDYEFNRVHSLNPFILFQHETSPPWDELIYGLTYTISL